jgi:PPOX class probable F420-dependent enzyme
MRSTRTAAVAALAPFERSWATLLTTFKRDGSPVGTPVNLAVEGDHAYFRSYHKAWKTKRIRNNPDIAIAPSTVRGKPTGQTVPARARLLSGDEERHARQVIARRYPVFQRLVIPFGHKVSRYTSMHYEVSLRDVST